MCRAGRRAGRSSSRPARRVAGGLRGALGRGDLRGPAIGRAGAGVLPGRQSQPWRRSGAAPDVQILLAVMPFVGQTTAAARAAQRLHNDLVHPLVGLATLSSHANYDLAQHALDEPVGNVRVQGMQGLFDTVVQLERHRRAESGRRRPALRPERARAADRRHAGARWPTSSKRWFISEACDGFVISPSHLPGAFDDVCRSGRAAAAAARAVPSASTRARRCAATWLTDPPGPTVSDQPIVDVVAQPSLPFG